MSKNSEKIILDLCGGTGAWSKPYSEAGYDVRIITLPEYDVCDYEVPENVYGILAAPPCTEFSLAKGNKKRDFVGAMKIVKSCLEIIWIAKYDDKLRFWCLENPLGFLRQFLGIPRHTFEQWQFGELLVKKTDLWGYFNMPKPTIKDKPTLAMMMRYPNGKTNARCWSKPNCPEEYSTYNLSRQDLRAITPPGFAMAFFEVNQ
jgi:hypothetical protein